MIPAWQLALSFAIALSIGVGVAIAVERVERAQVRGDGHVLELDRPLQVLPQTVERPDPRARRGNDPVLADLHPRPRSR